MGSAAMISVDPNQFAGAVELLGVNPIGRDAGPLQPLLDGAHEAVGRTYNESHSASNYVLDSLASLYEECGEPDKASQCRELLQSMAVPKSDTAKHVE